MWVVAESTEQLDIQTIAYGMYEFKLKQCLISLYINMIS